MASTFCSFIPRSGLKRVDKCLCNTRSKPGSRLSSLRSSGFRYSDLKFFDKSCRRRSEFSRQNESQDVLLKHNAKTSDIATGKNEEDDAPKATLIWRAIKLPIYSVALVPLIVGSAAAYFQVGIFSAGRFLVLLISSVLVIGWLNLSNDVHDFSTGADKNKRESVVNLLGSYTGTLIAAYSLLALGFFGLTWASIEAGSLRAILLLAAAITCGYIYQCPPFRLSYVGLGEPLSFAAFGPFATSAFYLLQNNTREIMFLPQSTTILSASVLVGFTTTLILFCSHFHQIEGDKAVGKISPLVRLGTERGSKVVKVAIMALYALLFALGLSRSLPFACVLLCGLTLPMGKLVVSFVQENHKDKGKIFMAKYYCVRLHALFGTALAAGLVAARVTSSGNIPRLKFF